MERTSIQTTQPRLRPPLPAVGAALAHEQPGVMALEGMSPVTVHPLVRAAERVNRVGCEWWFVGLLVSVFAAMVGRGLCG